MKRLATSVLLAATLASCSSGVQRPPLAVDAPDSVGTWGFAPNANEVLLVQMSPMHVREPVTFESATLAMASGRMELLAVRVGAGGGSSCSTAPWPQAGYGSTRPLEGYAAAPGDRPALAVYLRPDTPEATTGAILLTYRDSKGNPRVLRIANERVRVEPADNPAGDRCHGSSGFGNV